MAKGQLGAWPAKPGSGPYVCPAPTGSNFTLTTLYLLDQGGGQVTELAVNAGTVSWMHSNAWEGGRLTGTYDSAGLHFDIADPLGTKRVQVNSSGVPELNCLMFPWGNDFNNTFVPDCVTPTGGSAASDATEHHFTKKERDNESGNDYFGARYYASSVGRFMSPDWSAKAEPVPYAKLADPQSLNLYAYVGNNPLGGVDADGHDYFSDMRDKDQEEAEEEAKEGDPQPGQNPAPAAPPAPAQQQSVAAQCPGCGDMNSAGAAAEKAALPLTQASVDAKDYHEYGGYILESKSNPDQFTYSKPLAGKETLVDIDNIKAPKGYNVVGEYHTHPRGPGDNREGFSTRDGNRYNGNGRVGYVADNNTRRMYVFVPGLTVNHPEWERTGDFVQKIP